MKNLKSAITLILALAISAAFAEDNASPLPLQQQQYQYPPPQEVQQFSNLQRLATMALNTVPGLGSFLIMGDYLGASVQLYLAAIGITAIGIGVSFTEDVRTCSEYTTSSYSSSYSSSTTTRCSSHYESYGDGPLEYPGLLYIGAGMLAANVAFNIFRSLTYGEPAKSGSVASKFNLSAMPNRRGEVMPYLTYSKTF